MSKTVLVVEDEPKIAHWVRTHFEQAGFKVLLASDGATGLALVQSEQPDLAILDINLPGMSGLEICLAIRQHQNKMVANLPIIVLAARIEEVDRLKGFELGADDYVIKPFSPKELAARAQAIFRRMPLRRGSTSLPE